MSRNRRDQQCGRLLITAILAVLSVGCGSSDSGSALAAGSGGSGGSAGDAGSASDGSGGEGGLPPYFDASPEAFVNNPIEQLFADPERSPGDLLGVDSADAQGYLDAARACYADRTACDTNGCRAFASCCRERKLLRARR